MEKLWKIIDAMKRAAARDGHAGLYAEYEDLMSAASRYGAWEDEGKRYGEPRPDKPTLRDTADILRYQGYKWDAKTGEVVKIKG